MKPWEGKQLWIWELEQCGAPQDVVNKAVALGLTGLIVKGWDGGNYWSQIEQIIGPAHDVGLLVAAWGYSYGTNVAGEAEAAKRCLDAGADWLVIDAEVEYEQYPDRADAVLEAFKAFGCCLGYTSYGIPSYHAGFPWQKFSNVCQVAMPQVYWGDFGMSVEKSLSMSLDGCRAYGLPVTPVGQAYGNVPADEIIHFSSLCKEEGLPGVSFWDWQHAGEDRLAAVGAAGYEKTKEVTQMPEEWKIKIMEDAKKAGLITEDHQPDDPAPKWFVLAVALNIINKEGTQDKK